MSNKQVKATTAAQLKEKDKLCATRAAHEDRLLDKINPPTKGAREALEGTIKFVFEQLEQAGARLEAEDLAVGVERQDDDPARRERDEATRAAYKLMVKSRAMLAGSLGEEAATRYGLEGATPQQPDALLGFVTRAVGLMEQSPGKFTDMFGNTVDTAAIVAQLKPAAARLKAALDAVRIEDSELNAALLARDTTSAQLERTTRAARLLMQALHILADEEALWDKEA
jgi:hypothetical protein